MNCENESNSFDSYQVGLVFAENVRAFRKRLREYSRMKQIEE